MKVADNLGIKVEFTDRLSNPSASAEIDKADGTVKILNSADNKVQLLFIHELTHYLENAKGYGEFKKAVFESKAFNKWLSKPTPAKSYQSYESIDEYRRVKENTYGTDEREYIDGEIIATFVSENLFQGDKGLENLIGESVGEKQSKIKEFLKKVIRYLREKFGSLGRLEKEFKSLLATVEGKSSVNEKNTGNGVRNYLADVTGGKSAVVIEENILDGVPKKDWIKTVKNTISEKFSTGIPISGRLIKVNSISKNEYTKSKYSQYLKATDGTVYADKFKSANNLDEILLATTNYINEDLKHQRKDKFKEFARGDVLIQVGNNKYSAKVIVGFTSSGKMVLYDIVSFKPTDFTIKKRVYQDLDENRRAPRKDTLSIDNISQNDNDVNSIISEKSKKDTKAEISDSAFSNGEKKFAIDDDYISAVERGDTETAQKLVEKSAKNWGAYSFDGKKPTVLYHGTNAEFTVFDIGKTSKINDLGQGFYFTNIKSDANKNYASADGGDVQTKIESLAFDIFSDMGYSEEDLYNNEYIDEYNKAYEQAEREFNNGKVLESYLKITNPLYVKTDGSLIDKNSNKVGKMNNNDIDYEQIQALGYDGLIDENVYNKFENIKDKNAIHYVVFNSNQVKSADTVTYNDQGEVIPLSERFNDSDSDIRFSIEDYVIDEQKLKNNARKVLEMDSVADLVGNEFDGPTNTLNERIDKFFESLNNTVYSKEYGYISLSKTSRRSDVRHGRTKNKITSYKAIPEVIKFGKTVFAIKKNNSERVVLSAPITISRQKYYMGVMLQRDNQNQRLYLHDVVIEKEIDLSSSEHLTHVQGRLGNTNLSMSSILKRALKVNTENRIIFDNEDNRRYSIDDRLPNGEFDKSGNYIATDSNGEEYKLTPKQLKQYLRAHPYEAILDKRQIERKAEMILKAYGSIADKVEVASELDEIYYRMKIGKEYQSKVEPLANKIYEHIVEELTAESKQAYEEIRQAIPNMYWDERIKAQFSRGGSEWNEFIRKQRVKLNLSKKGKVQGAINPIDAYVDLAEEFPQYFDQNKSVDEYSALTEIAERLYKLETHYDTFNEAHKDEVLRVLKNDIVNGYYGIGQFHAKTKIGKTNAKEAMKEYRYQEEYSDESGFDEKRYREDQRIQLNRKLNDYVSEQTKLHQLGEIGDRAYERNLKNAFAKISLQAKIKPIERSIAQKYKDKEKLKSLNKRITTDYNDLKTALNNPTEGKFIPKELIPLVEDLVKMVESPGATTTAEIKRQIEQIRQFEADEGVIEETVKELEDIISKQKSLSQVWGSIVEKYDSYHTEVTNKKNEATELNSYYCWNETVSNKLHQVSKILENADIQHLTLRQTEALQEGIHSLSYFVKNSVKMIGLEQEWNAYEASEKAIAEIERSPIMDNWFKKVIQKGINQEINGDMFFRRLGGYQEGSVWEQIGEMFNNGEMKSANIRYGLQNALAPLIEGSSFDKAKNERSYRKTDLVDIGLVDKKTGKTIKVPRAFMLSAVLHLENKNNRTHALKGGFTVPSFSDYYKHNGGGYAEGTVAVFEDIDRAYQKMEKLLTDYEKSALQTVREFFNKHTKNYYNESTMEVFGFERAKVEKYFPIYTDSNYTTRDFLDIQDGSLKNQGNMKERQLNAGNPILLSDVYDVVMRETGRCADYCGKLKAEITFKRIYNTNLAGYEGSIKQSLGQRFGETGVKYLENLIKDYLGVKRGTPSPTLNKLRSNLSTSALLLNANVAAQQFAAYPQAAAVLGWKALNKALYKSTDGRHLIYKAPIDLINKYSPLYQNRVEGFMKREIGDTGGNSIYESDKTQWAFGWMTYLDSAVVGRLWTASEYYIQDSNPELEVGSDKYYKEVAKIFNKTVNKTQATYTSMQRPAVLRNPNEIVRGLTIFTSQPLLMFGTLYDATKNLSAQKRYYKEGKVSKQAVKKARLELARAVSSVMVSTVAVPILQFVSKAVTGRLYDYLDDETGKLTIKSISSEILNGFGSSLFGMITFGNYVYEAVASAISGDMYYGIDLSVLELVASSVEKAVSVVNDCLNGELDFDSAYKAVEAVAMMFGVPIRNAKNLIRGVLNLVQEGDYYALSANQTNAQLFEEMYYTLAEGNKQKYLELYQKAVERDIPVNEIRTGIKNALKIHEQELISEAVEAKADGKTDSLNEIVDELVEKGFDDEIVRDAIDDEYKKQYSQELSEEQESERVKELNSYYLELLESVNFDGMSSKQKADTQDFIMDIASEYAIEKVTGEVKNEKIGQALGFDSSGIIPIEDYIISQIATSAEYADTDGNGKVDTREKYEAIGKANISSVGVKELLQGIALMGTKQVDTDNDGEADTAFDDLTPKAQSEYINKNKPSILELLDEFEENQKKSAYKAEYIKDIKTKVDISKYSQSEKGKVQEVIKDIAGYKAKAQVSGEWDSKTVQSFLYFDESGFIDIDDYINFKVHSDGKTKKAELFKVINNLSGVSDKAKLKLKLYIAVKDRTIDDKKFTQYSPKKQETYIRQNVSKIISDSQDWK